jgi:hypothetical protein
MLTENFIGTATYTLRDESSKVGDQRLASKSRDCRQDSIFINFVPAEKILYHQK